MSARTTKQTEALPLADAPHENRDATGDKAGAPEGKAKPGTTGPVLDWNLPPCDDYAVWVIGIRPNGTHAPPVQPDFSPRAITVKIPAGENKANGNGGAKQAMWGRAVLYADNARIAAAFVVRSANPARGTGRAVWRVFGNGGGVKEVPALSLD